MTSSNGRVLVDTNVLLYAQGGDDDPRARESRKVLRGLWRTGNGVVSTQVLQEFYAVATRKLRPVLPRRKARDIVTAYAEWCQVTTDVSLIVAASRLEEEHTLAFWDALIVEAALRSGAVKLLSADLQHGRRFGDLVIENPYINLVHDPPR